jgi:hypothetical protein
MKTAIRTALRASLYPAPQIDKPAIRELMEMHTYARPAGSSAEVAFNARFLDSMEGMQIDDAGNRYLRVGTAPVLWSSHTDTVHKKSGRARLAYGDGILSLAEGDKAACLGADDSAGVWIMRQMVLRRIPGLYIFHAGEEIGGIGSAHIARNTPELLDGINHAIALDRRGTSSVITHQMGRCASDSFAQSLADYLGGEFEPDDSGTFTDTANYTALIPECTNLSVGYYGAHSAAETLDIGFCAHLLERLCGLDTETLPIERDMDEDEYGYGFADDSPDLTLEDLVYENPRIAAELLEDYRVSVSEFRAAMEAAKLRRWRR